MRTNEDDEGEDAHHAARVVHSLPLKGGGLGWGSLAPHRNRSCSTDDLMHLLSTSSTSLDDIVEPVDLGQTPGDIAILSFADSDLAGLSAAWTMERDALPSVRLVQLRELKHPMSVDLWIERVAAHAKVIVVRLLG